MQDRGSADEFHKALDTFKKDYSGDCREAKDWDAHGDSFLPPRLPPAPKSKSSRAFKAPSHLNAREAEKLKRKAAKADKHGYPLGSAAELARTRPDSFVVPSFIVPGPHRGQERRPLPAFAPQQRVGAAPLTPHRPAIRHGAIPRPHQQG